jgi:hypothetical protein
VVFRRRELAQPPSFPQTGSLFPAYGKIFAPRREEDDSQQVFSLGSLGWDDDIMLAFDQLISLPPGSRIPTGTW